MLVFFRTIFSNDKAHQIIFKQNQTYIEYIYLFDCNILVLTNLNVFLICL